MCSRASTWLSLLSIVADASAPLVLSSCLARNAEQELPASRCRRGAAVENRLRAKVSLFLHSAELMPCCCHKLACPADFCISSVLCLDGPPCLHTHICLIAFGHHENRHGWKQPKHLPRLLHRYIGHKSNSHPMDQRHFNSSTPPGNHGYAHDNTNNPCLCRMRPE